MNNEKLLKEFGAIEAKINEPLKIKISDLVRPVIIIFYEEQEDKKKWAEGSTCASGRRDFDQNSNNPETMLQKWLQV